MRWPETLDAICEATGALHLKIYFSFFFFPAGKV
jgi:hypothetical protein